VNPLKELRPPVFSSYGDDSFSLRCNDHFRSSSPRPSPPSVNSRELTGDEMGCAGSSGGSASKGSPTSTTRKIAVNDESARKGLARYEAPKVVFQPLLPICSGSHVPKARKQHTLAVVDEHSLFFFGGLCTSDDRPADPNVVRQTKEKPQVSNQMFHFTPRDMSWHHPVVSGEPPSARCTHMSVSYDGSLFIYGSHNHKDQTLFQYRAAFARWSQVNDEGEHPSAAAGASACVAGDLMLIFGGDTGNKVTNELFAFEFLNSKWYKVEDTRNDITVQGRRDHSAVVFEDKMMVFGGFGRVSDELEFIQFSATTKSWSLVPIAAECTIPERRGAHCCALYHHFMFVFGGMHHRKFLNDLHVFNILTGVWTEVTIEGPARHAIPAKRGFGVSAICGHQWFMHGGTDDVDLFRDFFSLDCNELCKAADPTFVPPSSPIGANGANGKNGNAENGNGDGQPPKKLMPGDPGYNKYNIKYFSPLWNDVVTRSSRPVIEM
jgi:hypothetical protein